VAQEAALRAWRRRHSCRDPTRPWAWLAQITRNEASRQARRRPAEPAGELESAADGLADDVVERVAVREAMATLADVDRVLLRGFYEDDLSVSSLADLTGLSPGAVRVRMHRARAALRSVLDER
jgi:RNA polymerase sigma factor (sigma-70 family)